MEFSVLADRINNQFEVMLKHDTYRVAADKHMLWDLYLSSFAPGTNETYIERTEHDCNTCKNFIRDVGNMIAIKDNGDVMTIWDITAEAPYDIVIDALREKVLEKPIDNIFSHHSKKCGSKKTLQEPTEAGGLVKTWNHFYCDVPAKYIAIDATELSKVRSTVGVVKRALEEISDTAVDTIAELIAQGSLYKGDEFKDAIVGFKKLKKAYLKLEGRAKEVYVWKSYSKKGARIRNSAIGTLITDLSEGVELEKAVKMYESKVAPANYKRPKALITESMIKRAMVTIEDLGIRDSLARRFAVPEDISVANVLFADRTIQTAMKDSMLDSLMAEKKVKPVNFDKVEEISIQKFIDDILPNIESMEALFENKHSGNLVTMVAPIHSDAPSILKWDNNFTWSYNGNVTDSMKERVKEAGGNIIADLRFSIQWNEEGTNPDDLDAWCTEANGNRISFHNKKVKHPSSGMLDVDITSPGRTIAVENITWTDKRKMPKGTYKMVVNNYSHRAGRGGFRAQIEFDGTIHEFDCNEPTSSGMNVAVADVRWDGEKFTLIEKLKSSTSSNTIWDIKTQDFQKVDILTISPNFWDGQEIGNKHYFFILNGCLTDQEPRGFYNEFLKQDMQDHRKVFEVLGSKMKCEMSDHQLTGLGFSSTQRNSLIVKVQGKFTRLLKINF